MNRTTIWTLVLSLALATRAEAAVLAREDFAYADGALGGQNGISGWSGAWSAGGAATVASGVANVNGGAAFRTLATPITPTTGLTIYVGFDLGSNPGDSQTFSGLSFYRGAQEILFVGGAYEYGLNVTGLANIPAGVVLDPSPEFLVARILFNSATTFTVDLYLNPTRLLGVPVATYTGIFLPGSGSWDRVRLAADTYGASPAPTATFDNIVIATELNEAVGPTCGDGLIEVPEQCDDDEPVPGDGCSSTCQIETGWSCSGAPSMCAPVCGDNLLTGPEQCDDGAVMSGDGCSSTCTVEPGYGCMGNPSSCAEICGDGLVVGNEGCDDENVSNGDGCDATCMGEAGWTCSGEPSLCAPACGDGLIRGTEGCDDMNLTAGDGCSAACSIETGWSCAGEPSGCSANCGDSLVLGAEDCDEGSANGVPPSCCSSTCTYQPANTACADGDLCNGDETCDGAGTCDPGMTLDCGDDGNPCTQDTCDPIDGCVTPPEPVDTPCPDGDVCNGDETCDGAGTCDPGMTLDCGDGDACTQDSCDPIDGCENPAEPATTCLTTWAKASLLVKENVVGKEKLKAKLLNGSALGQGDFGDPLMAGGTAYTVCVYDGADNLAGKLEVDRAGMQCAGSDCWKAISTKGYLYKDKDASAHGVSSLKLLGGTAGKSKILLKAANNAAKGQTSLPTGIAAALNGSTSATVQIHRSDAPACFSTTLSTVLKDTGNFFKAK